MEKHEALHELVFAKVEWHNSKGNCPTARELFEDARRTAPRIASNGFKSFARLIKIFPDIKPINVQRGIPRRYKAIE